jgi:cytochrome c oxidase subunit 1
MSQAAVLTGTAVEAPSRPDVPPGNATYEKNYLSAVGFDTWLLTGDHKRIGIMYLICITIAFYIGALFAALIRLELMTPQADLLSADNYNKAFTMHGVMMIFFFLIPSVPATLGNFLVPLMIGARDLAFPKINLMSWYLYIGGASFAIYAILAGGVDTGWTFYTPYSTSFSNTNVVATGLGAFLVGFSSIFTGFNFLVTIHKMRAPGLTWFRLPLFIWANYATALIMILGTPVVGITVALLAVERLWGVGIFDPNYGGDPILYQHMFWFYSHPAVYIMILPGFGVISEVISCFSRKNIYGYKFIAASSLAIALIGFFVWGHHMYVSGQSGFAGVVFSALTMLIAVPSGVKVFNWAATLYKGSITFETPMLYALGFIGLFVIGGLTGLYLGSIGLDTHLHDTYFVVAHFHYVMVGGMTLALLCGLHFWWPKMSGRMYPEFLGKLGALIVFIGFNLAFFPQFVMGQLGMPRHYATYVPEYQVYHVLSTAGSSVLGAGFLLVTCYLTWSWFFGKLAPANPYRAMGLEWSITSPPPTENFKTVPVVNEDPYDYAEMDFREDGSYGPRKGITKLDHTTS